ncbi:hypothetical protein Ocin01_15115 [Orchesella cincta]|uniref:Uncharacterized protein n=1 Tax=Orchesella cincta TaxID=48709 RepID=A0A1D2MEZ1_ORCCI|nr:hypothetical protein Ocin01_15115 [Orchesella cincta]
MDSDGVTLTFRKLSSPSHSKFTEILSDFEKLDFAHDKCTNVEDTLNYNEGREANPFDKMGNYYGRHKDVFLFNRILRDKKMRMKIDELLSVKDDDIKTRFFTRLQLYLERLEVGEQEAKRFLEEALVAEAFYTGPRGVEKENLNLNLGNDGVLRIGTVFDGKLDELKRLKVHGNGRRLVTVLKNGEQKNYSFTKATSCDMEIKWVANEKRCQVEIKVDGGGKLVKKAMVDGKQVKLEELIPLAKQNKGVLIRDRRLYQVLEECLQKGMFSDEKEEVEEEKLIVKEVLKVDDDDAQVVEFFAELGKNLDVLKEQGVKDPLGKLRSDYGRNGNVFILKKILKDELLRERFLNLVKESLGGDAEKLERKVDKMLEKFLQGEKLAQKIVGDEEIDAFVAGGENGNTNLNLNLNKKRTELEKLFEKAAAKGVKRIKVFGGGQRLLTILQVGGKQRNYSFRDLAQCELDLSWKAGSGNDIKTCQLVLDISSGKIFALNGAVNGNPVALEDILELAKQNRKVLINGKPLHLVLEKILAGGDGGSIVSMKSIGSQEKLTFHGIFKEQQLLQFDGSDEQRFPDAVDRFFERLLTLDFSEGAEPNAFNTLAKYYGREKKEDVFFFQTILRDPNMKQKMMSMIKSSTKCEENQLQQFNRRMERYLKRIENGEKDAKEFLGDGNAFFHGYHVAHPEHPRNIHENLNINLAKRTNITFETGDNLFAKVIPAIVQEQSELRRVKMYGNGTRLATVLKLDGGQRNYDFEDEAGCDLEVGWVAKEEEMECTLILNVEKGKLIFRKGLLNGDEMDKEKIIEFAKENKIVFIKGKNLAEILEEKTVDPDDHWEVLFDGNEN